MEFFDALVRCETYVWNEAERRLTRAGLASLGTVQALRVVARLGGSARVQEISTELGITVGAASKLVDRMERSRWVERSPHPTDRRSSLVALTGGGEAMLTAAVPLLSGAVEELLAEESGIARVTRLLERVAARVHQPAAGAEVLR